MLDQATVQLIVQIAFLVMAIMYFFRPPQWIKNEISDLMAWAPRLIGSLKGGAEAQEKQYMKMMSEGGTLVQLIGLLPHLAPLLNNLPQLIQMAQQSGLLDGLSRNTEGALISSANKGKGGLWS